MDAVNRAPNLNETFSLVVQNVILIFDKKENHERHVEHVKIVLTEVCGSAPGRVRAHSHNCIFDVETPAKAGFVVEALPGGGDAFMVVDQGKEWASSG